MFSLFLLQNVPLVTQMVVHMPKTPNATPVTRGSTVFTDLDATPDPSKRGEISPLPQPSFSTSPRQPTIVTQKSLALTPDISGKWKHEVKTNKEKIISTISKLTVLNLILIAGVHILES